MNDTTPGDLPPAPPRGADQPACVGGEPRMSDARILRVTCWWCRHPRPSYARPTGARRIFIPIYGWFDVDDDHRTRVERFFHVPMLMLALLVLPILLIEWSYGGRFETAHPAVRVAIYVSGAVIWLAFLVEFIIKISIAESRWKYATRNWLDIVIVALPMLRPLRSFRVLRAAEVARVSRVFTLRGVVMKLLRTAAATVLGLEFVHRVLGRFRGPPAQEDAPDYERWSHACLIAEIRRLNDRIRELEKTRHDPDVSRTEEPDRLEQ